MAKELKALQTENARLKKLVATGNETFFDGFGFSGFRSKFDWSIRTPDDDRESTHPRERPLIHFLQTVSDGTLPEKWDRQLNRFVPNDDRLLFGEVLESRADPASP